MKSLRAEFRPCRQNGTVILAGLAGVLLAACGAATQSQGVASGSGSGSGIIQAWAEFPVHASPRPIVMVGGRVLDPQGGFLDLPSKEAYIRGLFDRPAHLPSGPTTFGAYPLIGADEAFAVLRSDNNATGTPVSQPGTRLMITGARFGAGTFLTDRGDRTMPAWLFTIAGVENPATVLAVAPQLFWSPKGGIAGRPYASFINGAIGFDGAQLSKDHRTLTVGFTGAASGTGPCTASYELHVTESAAAVAVKVTAHPNGSGTEVCTLEGHPRQASAALGAALGNRVVIDSITGGPIAVYASP